MFIQRFLERRRIKRLRRQMRERIVLVIILGAFLLNCCVCMALGLVDAALRDIGILPTYTPSPPVTPEPTDAELQGGVIQIERYFFQGGFNYYMTTVQKNSTK